MFGYHQVQINKQTNKRQKKTNRACARHVNTTIGWQNSNTDKQNTKAVISLYAFFSLFSLRCDCNSMCVYVCVALCTELLLVIIVAQFMHIASIQFDFQLKLLYVCVRYEWKFAFVGLQGAFKCIYPFFSICAFSAYSLFSSSTR